MKYLLTACLSLALVCIVRAGDVDDVKAAFEDYKSSILGKEGNKAVTVVTQSTLDEYQKYIDWARTGDRAAIEGLSMFNRFQVMLIRHRIPASELKELDGAKVFSYAVDKDWIGKNSVIRMSIGQVDVSNGRATAEMVMGEEKLPNRFQFIKEDNAWKLDLRHTMMEVAVLFPMFAKERNLGENEYIFMMIEAVSGTKVTEKIWDPVN